MKAALNLLVLRKSLERSTLSGRSLGGRYHFLPLPLLLTPVECFLLPPCLDDIFSLPKLAVIFDISLCV